MAKVKKIVGFGIAIGTENRWTDIPVIKEDKGYFAGTMLVGDVNFHIEAIEVRETTVDEAVNPIYQNRIDSFCHRNEGLAPTLLIQNNKKYFINIESFAQ